MDKNTFLLELLEEKVLSCKYLFKKTTEDMNPGEGFDSKAEIIKRLAYITALVSDLGMVSNISKRPEYSILKTTLTIPENVLFDKLRRVLRNDLQHADERIDEFFNGNHNRPIQRNILKQGNEWFLLVDMNEKYPINPILDILRKIHRELLNILPNPLFDSATGFPGLREEWVEKELKRFD